MKTQTTPLSLTETKQVNGGFLIIGSGSMASYGGSSNRLSLVRRSITQALRETGGLFNFTD